MYMESKYWLATDSRIGGNTCKKNYHEKHGCTEGVKVILKQINKMQGEDEQKMMSIIRRKVQNELNFPGKSLEGDYYLKVIEHFEDDEAIWIVFEPTENLLSLNQKLFKI